MKIKLSKSQWKEMGRIAGWDNNSAKLDPELISSPKGLIRDIYPEDSKNSGKKFESAEYIYHINLNERGSFFADVRNSSGETVFEIKAGNELNADESSIFEDGFMKNIHDMQGLKDYLVSMGIMKPNQKLKDMQPKER